MQKIVDTLGSPSGGNSNYTGACFARWGLTAALGLSKSLISQLRTDNELYMIMNAMKKFESEMTESQVRHMFHIRSSHNEVLACIKMLLIHFSQTKAWSNLLKTKLNTNSAVLQFDDSKASQVSVFMKHFRWVCEVIRLIIRTVKSYDLQNDESLKLSLILFGCSDSEIERLNRSVIPSVCMNLGKASMHTLPLSEIQRLKNLCLKYIVSIEPSVHFYASIFDLLIGTLIVVWVNHTRILHCSAVGV